MFLSACFTFEMEFPRFDTMRYFSLSLLINRNTRRGKNPAIIIATGLRAMFVNRAFVVDQHGAVPLVAITHEHVPLRQAGGGKHQCAERPLDRLRFFRLDMYEHGRAATPSAGTARYISLALSLS